MDKYVGKKLDGRYEIRELIGVGGMANVYHCYDTVDDREVAIKILKDEFLNNDDFIRRFKNESKAIAVLSHPNIVKVYDVSFGDMIQYIVMEYIDGITLKEYIDRQGVIDWKEALHLTTQILKALQHAHENGIVHRDIKPQNIMLLENGTIKVTDFGIARFSNNATRTMTDQAIGSVHYIAPEQARGDITDGKTDIYSVGVMLYEMLTGKLPFEADNAVSVALMQLQSTPKKPRAINPSIPQGLEEITLKAMQKVPTARYVSAVDMLNDIERFRLNPAIRFEYGGFVDNEPTKYVKKIGDADQDKRRKSDYNDQYNSQREKSQRYDDDDDQKTPKTSISVIKGVLIAAVLVIIVFGTMASIRGCNSTQAKNVDVPNLTGMMLTDAMEQYKDKFNLIYESEFDETKELGVIIDQDPQPNSKQIKEGASITVTVNGQDTMVSTPYVINDSEADAVKAIKEKNLSPQVLYIEDPHTTVGYVREIFPKAGVKVNIGSTVYVYVSKGAKTDEKIEIPNVTGMSLTNAQEMLREKGLEAVYTVDEECTKPKDEVLEQSPLYGGKVEKGYKVNLVISGGKETEKEVEIHVDLPTGVTDTVALSVIVDGVVDDVNSKNVVPKYSSTYSVKLKGTGKSTVVIELNGEVYREYVVEFATGTVTNTIMYEYPPTEPSSEEETTEPQSNPDSEEDTHPEDETQDDDPNYDYDET